MRYWQDTEKGKDFIDLNNNLLQRFYDFSNFTFSETKSRSVILSGVIKKKYFRNEYIVEIRFSPQLPIIQPIDSIFILYPKLRKNTPQRYPSGAIKACDANLFIPWQTPAFSYLLLTWDWLIRYELFLMTGYFIKEKIMQDYLKEIGLV